MPVVFPADVHFADGQGHARLVTEVPERVHVVQAHDVLQPHQVQIPHGLGDAQGRGKLEESVAVQEDLDPVAHPFAHFLQRLDAFPDRRHGKVTRSVGPVRPVEGPELHARVALRHQFLGQVARGVMGCPVVFQRTGFADVPVAGPALLRGRPRWTTSIGGTAAAVVDTYGFPRLSTQKLPHGPAARLTQDVPEGQVYGAQGAHLRSAGSEGAHPFIEEAPVVLDRTWIAAQQTAGQPVMDHGGHRVGDVVGLPVADGARVGVDPKQDQPGHDIVGDEGLHGGDLQVGTSRDGRGVRRDGVQATGYFGHLISFVVDGIRLIAFFGRRVNVFAGV